MTLISLQTSLRGLSTGKTQILRGNPVSISLHAMYFEPIKTHFHAHRICLHPYSPDSKRAFVIGVDGLKCAESYRTLRAMQK